MLSDLFSAFDDFFSIFPPNSFDTQENFPKRRHAVAWFRREIGSTIEGLTSGSKKYAHWPATLPGHRHDRLHVDVVNVWAFLAVNFDVDEMLVHQRRGIGIFEGLMFHDMAPMASRVPNAQKDGLILAAGFFQRLFTPGIPVDGIFCMLQQIGRVFIC